MIEGGAVLNIDNKIYDRINKIEWFDNCGEITPIHLAYEVKFVDTWDKAKKYYNQSMWEDTTLEAQNKLTIFLQNKYRNDYSQWNTLTVEAKKFLKKEIVPQMNLVKEKHNLDDSFVSCVSWDMLGAIMEHAYKECKNRPAFFLDLLSIYEKGHFPCGWEGKWPDGKLIVF